MASVQAWSVYSSKPYGDVDGTTRAVKLMGRILGSEPGTEVCRVTILACIHTEAMHRDTLPDATKRCMSTRLVDSAHKRGETCICRRHWSTCESAIHEGPAIESTE